MFQRENLEEIMSIFEGLDTKLSHGYMGSELDLSFSKLSNSLW